MNTLPRDWTGIRRDWNLLTLHQRFETAIAFVLTFVIWAVVLVALRVAETVGEKTPLTTG